MTTKGLPQSDPRVSFCMPCKNRAHDVKETLPRTLKALLPGDEVVLLDYDSEDDLTKWVAANLMAEIRSERVRYIQLVDKPTPWETARPKNVAHRAARREIVCNLDADNWLVPGYSGWLRNALKMEPKGVIHMSIRAFGGGYGRIAMLQATFMDLGGYDERFKSWGYDDNDLLVRAKALGYKLMETPDEFLAFKRHPDATRKFSEGITQKSESLALNRKFTEQALSSKNYRANSGHEWGICRVQINFGAEGDPEKRLSSPTGESTEKPDAKPESLERVFERTGAAGVIAHLNGQLKVQIGSGGHRPRGWLNLEKSQADIRRVLPFPDESLTALKAEHVIHQVSVQEAYRFFQEAWRVLLPGGTLRLAIPCPAKLMATCTQEYLNFCLRGGWSDGSLRSAIAGLIFRDNVQSVWSRELLETILQSLGWRTMVQPIGMSPNAELAGAECHGAVIGSGNNNSESIIIEALKGADDSVIFNPEDEASASSINSTFGPLHLVVWPSCSNVGRATDYLEMLGISFVITEGVDRSSAHVAALRKIASGVQEAGLVTECGLEFVAGYASMLESAVACLPKKWNWLTLTKAKGRRLASHLVECTMGVNLDLRCYAVHYTAATDLAAALQKESSRSKISEMSGCSFFGTFPALAEFGELITDAARCAVAPCDAVGIAEMNNFDVISTEALIQELPLPTHTMRDVYMGRHVCPRVIGWYNPCMIKHKGKQWLAYRTDCRPMFHWSRVNLVEMLNPSTPIAGTSRLLELPTRFGEWGSEDPRLFTAHGKLWLCYTDGWGIGLAELSDNGEVIRAGLFPKNAPIVRNGHERQKNWGFFEVDGRVYVSYWTSPHIVHEVDLKNWTLGIKMESDWQPPTDAGELHGGSNFVEREGLLWRVVHSHAPSGDDHVYRLWMMAIDARPPFRVRRFSRRPLLVGIPETDPTTANCVAHVVFCGGLSRESGGWRLTFGQNDKRMRTGVILDTLLDKEMTILPVPAGS
jgi:predicted GH43/DUF377 family glycosyl hydrolase